jgi:hypothetical protein
MDIFHSKAFSLIEMTDAVNKVPYAPTAISQLGLFAVRRVRTPFVAIEEREGILTLIPTSQRGEPINRDRTQEKRVLRNFNTARLADASTITAAEIEGVRAFGTESELVQVAAEVMRRVSGATGILRNFELTWERMRLGAIQGIVLDADGSTLYNWFTEFGITQAAEIDFDLDNATPAPGAVRKLCNLVIRQSMRAAKGAWIDGTTYLVAICGDAFWDDLTQNSEVRSTYLNTQQAADLRQINLPFETFRYGGIVWMNYRGTDDTDAAHPNTVVVPTNECKFFPVGAPGAFTAVFSPGEFFGSVNQPGRDLYSRVVIDPDAGGNMDQASWVKTELYSYPLFISLRPGMLQRGRRT